MSLTIRAAAPEDAALVLKFIGDLAEYEKLAEQSKATLEDVERDLFGAAPKVFADLAFWNDEPAGFALWFYTYSTFLGRHGIWLEDLFVEEALRGNGIGKGLLVHLARRCVREDLGRFEWGVLDWNKPSIEFYRAQGAEIMVDWEHCRVSGEALKRLGSP